MESIPNEISFLVFNDDSQTPIVIDENKSIYELKELVSMCCQIDMDYLVIYLEKVGQIDLPEMLFNPLAILGLQLKSAMTYCLFAFSKNCIDHLAKFDSFCTAKLVNDGIKQVGFKLKLFSNLTVCYPCARVCHQKALSFADFEDYITDQKFQCQCCKINNDGVVACRFTNCDLKNLVKNEGIKVDQNAIAKILCDKYASRKKQLDDLSRKEKNHLLFNKRFNFQNSIDFCMERFSEYKNADTIAKIRDLAPKRPDNAPSRDYIKLLLKWFKKEFFSWCNKPACPVCKENKDNICFLKACLASPDEKKFCAKNTELYRCLTCGQEVRFPRYNSPLKLLETRTGRCGEWANLFGAVLYALGFKVRLVENFEDHIWNEYFCAEEQRWLHVDSCEETLDNPLLYEQGWGRVMTFVLAVSDEEVADVTARYIKEYASLQPRRNPLTELELLNLLEPVNLSLRVNLSDEEAKALEARRQKEEEELRALKMKGRNIKKDETLPRQSGDDAWKKERGEG